MRKIKTASAIFISLTVVWFSLHAWPANADVLFFTNGDEVLCQIVQITRDKIYVIIDEEKAAYKRDEVSRIGFIKTYGPDDEDDLFRIKDAYLKELLKTPPAPGDYPEEDWLFCLYEKTYLLNEELSGDITHHIVKYVLREPGKNAAMDSFNFYAGDHQNWEIEHARSITNGRISYLTDMTLIGEAPYPGHKDFGHLRTMKFSIPGVEVGSFIDYKYKEKNLGARTAGSIYQQVYIPIESPTKTFRLNVIVPKGIEIVFSENDITDSVNINFTKNFSENYIKYTWEARNIKPLQRCRTHIPILGKIMPSISFCVENSWDQIQKKYSQIIADNLYFSPEMRQQVRELTKGIEESHGKIEAIYNWVVTQILLIPSDMKDSGYIPGTPAVTFKRKEGNYLDKVYLFYAMLMEAGFTPSFVFFKDKKLPEFSKALPTIHQFSIPAVLLALDGEEQIMCPLSSSRRYKELPGLLQDVTGIVLSGPWLSELFYISPVFPAKQESATIQAKLELGKDGSMTIDTVATFSGVEQARIRHLKELNEGDQKTKIEDMVDTYCPNAQIISSQIEHIDDLCRDIEFKLQLRIDRHAITAGDRFLAFQIPGLNYHYYEIGSKCREYPVFWMQRSQLSHRYEISLPEGYNIHYMPGSIRLEQDGNRYQADIEYKNNIIRFNDVLTRNSTEIHPGSYREYSTFMESIQKFTREWIVLTKYN